jgi:hypothetical protein
VRSQAKAAAGFEPANNGFANRRPQNVSLRKDSHLQEAETSAYKAAYKENPKTGENQPENLPPDLAEIVAVWPELPEHIKEAIRALVRTCR